MISDLLHVKPIFLFFFDKSLGQTFFAQAKVFSHTPHQRQVISAPHLATINI